MASLLNLKKAERDFFRLVSKAAFSNPFSPERERVDREIVEVEEGMSRRARVEKVMARVSEVVEVLEREGRDDFRKYTAEDQTLLRMAFLFHTYHRFIDQIDDLIQRQIGAGDTPCRVPFAREALDAVAAKGFTPVAAAGYLALFYQVRRAYYFIDQNLVGRSPCMTEFRSRLWNNVFTRDISFYERYLWNRMEDFSTLILGETGSGKGAAAAAIGRSGFIPFDENKLSFARSFTQTFLSINLSQFTESLIESELFGHRKGAFSGAIDHHTGVLARCAPNGVIFMDEIGEVSPPIQIKLLQVLQERTFCPVGSHDQIRFHGRVIAATNKPLDELRRSGRFREDFYYRLCSDVIRVPSLCERIREDPAELTDLVHHLIRRVTGTDSEEVRGLVMETLSRRLGPDYRWPGNVRELEQAIRRILLTHDYAGDAVPQPVDAQDSLIESLRAGTLDAGELLAGYCKLLHQRLGTYEEVARRTGLDRRTAKKYIEAAESHT